MQRHLCNPTQTLPKFCRTSFFVVFLLSWALLMHLVQQCLIAVVFDDNCFCRLWRLTADWKTVDLSALFYFYSLDWSDSFWPLASSIMFSEILMMMFIFSSSGLNGTDARQSVEEHADKPSKLNDFYYS